MTLSTCPAPDSGFSHPASPTGAGAPTRGAGAWGRRGRACTCSARQSAFASWPGPHAHTLAALSERPRRPGLAPHPRLWTPAPLLQDCPALGQSDCYRGPRFGRTPSPDLSRLHSSAGLSERRGRERTAARSPPGPGSAPAADARGAPPSPQRAPRRRPLLLPAGKRPASHTRGPRPVPRNYHPPNGRAARRLVPAFADCRAAGLSAQLRSAAGGPLAWLPELRVPAPSHCRSSHGQRRRSNSSPSIVGVRIRECIGAGVFWSKRFQFENENPTVAARFWFPHFHTKGNL